MKASDFPFQVGDRVAIDHPWGEREFGAIIHIPDGGEVDAVTILFDAGDEGEYAPEDCRKEVNNGQ